MKINPKKSKDAKSPTLAVLTEAELRAHPMADFFALKIRAMWDFFRKEPFAFWAMCGYLFVEYVRPQSIVPSLNFLPWGKIFIVLPLLGLLGEKNRKWVSTPLNKWMVAYLLVVIIATLTAYWPEESRKHFMDFFNWFLVFFLTVNIITTEKRLFIFVMIFLLASFKLSFFGAKTWALRGFSFTEWGLMGPEGFFQNSGEFAIQMLMMLPIGYRMAVAMKPWLSRVKYWIMIAMPITAGMSVLGASSRGAQIGLAFQGYMTFLRGKLSFKNIVLVVALGTAVYMLMPEEQLDRFRSTGGAEDKPGRQRLLYWKGGFEMYKEHPVLGVGFFNFAPYFDRHYPGDVLYGTAQLPHNIVMQVITDAGTVGLICWGGLVLGGFAATRSIRRKVDKNHWLHSLSLGYDASFVGFLIAGQFVSVAYYPFMWIQLAFTAATWNIANNLNPKPAGPVRRPGTVPSSS